MAAQAEGIRPAGLHQPGKYYRYYVMLLLSAIYLLSSIDRMMVSTVAEPLKLEFGLSDTQLGVLTGLYFAISFSICGIPVGLLVDRLNRVRLLSGLLCLWSLLTLVSGFAGSYAMLALARIGVGGAEAGAPAASTSLIGDYFPSERRGTALSFFYVSTPIGVAAAFFFGGMITHHFGWRASFLLAGLPGLILAALLVFTVREPRRGAFDTLVADGKPKLPSFAGVVPAMRANPSLLTLLLAGMCLVAAQAGTNAFVTPFLMRVHHLSIQQAGFALGTAQLLPGILGVLAGGVVADRLARGPACAAPFALAFLMLVTGPAAAAAYLVGDWQIAAWLLAAHYFLLSLYYGAHFSTYLSLSPVALRGTFAAIMAVMMTLTGYGLGPVLVGVTSDFAASMGAAQPLRWAEVAVSSIFLLASLFYAVSGFLLRRRPTAI